MGWTDERIETLKKLWLDGLSFSQIAKQLGGITRSAAIGKAHRLGLGGRAMPARPARLAKPARPPRPIGSPLSTPTTVYGRRRTPQPARPPQAVPLPRVVFDVAPTATSLTLTEKGCRWPIGDPGEDGFGFCGRMRGGSGPYCADHAPIARRPPQPGRPPTGVAELERSLRRYL